MKKITILFLSTFLATPLVVSAIGVDNSNDNFNYLLTFFEIAFILSLGLFIFSVVKKSRKLIIIASVGILAFFFLWYYFYFLSDESNYNLFNRAVYADSEFQQFQTLSPCDGEVITYEFDQYQAIGGFISPLSSILLKSHPKRFVTVNECHPSWK